MIIFVRDIYGKTMSIDINNCDSIANVKNKL